ncbi:uncharacterized protein EI90DRAFT_1412869 [Cantharellus anzutake]|uniref:uncharacterized protein n=1 Tax=Cantharellus anzutake TaxID=1750568 RepID=UPI001908CBE3|nr:uncharacterized protein EI90DRAFT_1412869 [Cantharellus anzutake]KAF8329568.1 hypothetical protein EI90DRAFT_1412869 [Cantharellus anzutake]
MEDPTKYREESPTASGSSISSSSPLMSPSHLGVFGLSHYMSMSNPELSSSSSESQSQESREQSPSDWPTSWTESNQLFTDSWKWNADSFIDSAYVDPTALTLGGDSAIAQSDSYYLTLPANIDATTLLAAYAQGFQTNNVQEQGSTMPVPRIVEPSLTPPFPANPPSTGPVLVGPEDIAKRAKERAGIQQAIPLSAVGAEHRPSFPHLLTPPPSMLQAPSLSPSFGSSVSSASSVSPTPPALPTSRNKTSHTDIERKYRSKLNNRFIALRHAVPALRILEKDRFPEEKVDERGYVDGVKAARKASKGSILGKATDYINVLKSLVGGRELYENWEREWKAQFGGEETGNVNEEEDGDDDEGSEDEDDKPKKKARIAPVTAPQKETRAEVAPPAAVPVPGSGELKRKRGRPRKVQPAPVAPQSQTPISPQVPSYTFMPQQPVPVGAAGTDHSKLFLGVFLLFSFFNPPSGDSSHHHAHSGTVLGTLRDTFRDRTPEHVFSPALQFLTTSRFMNLIHSVITLGLFVSVVLSVLPSATCWLPSFSKRRPPRKAIRSSDLGGDREALRDTLGCANIGLFTFISAVVAGWWYAFWVQLRHFAGIRPRPFNITLEREAWVRLQDPLQSLLKAQLGTESHHWVSSLLA